MTTALIGFAIAGVLAFGCGVLGWALIAEVRKRAAEGERLRRCEDALRVAIEMDADRSVPVRSGDSLWSRMRERAEQDELRRDDPDAK